MQKLPYAAWVNLELSKKPEEARQQARNSYYSYTGRIIRYDAYKAYAKANKRTPDGPPDGYYEYHTHAGHQIIAILTGILGMFAYVLVGVIGGAARPRR